MTRMEINSDTEIKTQRLIDALQGMVDNFKPFDAKPVGAPGSQARFDQEAQIYAHRTAVGLLKGMKS